METKSRYEVIAELEGNKRKLIVDRDDLKNVLLTKEKCVRDAERQKADNMIAWDRKIDDLKEDVQNFKDSMDDKKDTINALIASIDDSLQRFNKLQQAN